MNFVEELTWRGMIHSMMPGTEEQLEKNRRINKKLLPIISAIFTFLIILTLFYLSFYQRRRTEFCGPRFVSSTSGKAAF